MKSPPRMKLKKGKISVKDWTLDTIDEMQKAFEPIILESASEAISLAFKSTEAYMEFSWQGLNKFDDDGPLSIHFHVGLRPTEDDDVIFSFDLREMIKWMIEENTGYYDKKIEKFANDLRILANDIDESNRANKD